MRVLRVTMTAFSLLLAISGVSAVAQSRPQSTRMTCAQAAGMVFQRGAIVIGTGGYTYDRFVRDRSFCESVSEKGIERSRCRGVIGEVA